MIPNWRAAWRVAEVFWFRALSKMWSLTGCFARSKYVLGYRPNSGPSRPQSVIERYVMFRRSLILAVLMAAASAPLWAVANFVVGQEDINFGTLPPGYPSQTKTFSVKNTGNATGSFKVQISQSPTWITTSPGNNAT